MELVSVAALADNRVIGKDGEIPWESIPEDRRQYRERIADAPVILGRRTFETMMEDLPGRIQIVLSRSDPSYDIDSVCVVGSVSEAIAAARDTGADIAYVIGGGGIYSLFQPHIDRMVLSRIPGTYEGDTYYPEWDTEDWVLVSEEAREGFTLEIWERANS